MAKTTAKPDAEKSFSLISNEKLLAIYTAILKCAALENRATSLFQSGKLESDLHCSAGREASASAVTIDLGPEDLLAVTGGDWLPAFVKGMPAEAMFRLLGGFAPPNADQSKVVMPGHDVDQPRMVREHASAALTEKNGAIAVAFIGEGAESLSKWEKTISAAGKARLPIVFVQYIETKPVDMPRKTRSKHPEALVYGVPSMMVDAHDAVAVYRVAFEAIVRARQARGATLLQCGLSMHVVGLEADEGVNALDPIAGMERDLTRKGIEVETHKRHVIASFNCDLDLATRFLDRQSKQ